MTNGMESSNVIPIFKKAEETNKLAIAQCPSSPLSLRPRPQVRTQIFLNQQLFLSGLKDIHSEKAYSKSSAFAHGFAGYVWTRGVNRKEKVPDSVQIRIRVDGAKDLREGSRRSSILRISSKSLVQPFWLS